MGNIFVILCLSVRVNYTVTGHKCGIRVMQGWENEVFSKKRAQRTPEKAKDSHKIFLNPWHD